MSYHFANAALPSRKNRDALPCTRVEGMHPQKFSFD
jgi:hypothetical protein